MSTRYYKHPIGVDVPSVTTITGQLDKPALVAWAANAACDFIINRIDGRKEISVEELYPLVEDARKNFRTVGKTAMDIGSRVHDAIEVYLKTGKEPIKPSDEVVSAFLAFLEWKDANKVEVIHTEHTVYGFDFAGTEDLFCLFNSKKYVIDYKSSKGIWPEMRYQVAGYRSTHPDAEGCGILRLDKTTGYPEWQDTSKTYEDDLTVFNLLTSLWWAQHPNKFKAFQISKGGGER